MKRYRQVLVALLVGGLTTAVAIVPTEAQARSWQNREIHHNRNVHHRRKNVGHHRKSAGHHGINVVRHQRHHSPSIFGNIVFSLPRGFIKIAVGGVKFYYRDGAYYHKDRHGYHAVGAPIGACIARLPRGHDVIYVDGHKYYVYNDVYYEHTRDGYVVIDRPRLSLTKYNGRSKSKATAYADDEFTLRIPDNKGGYTPVIIKRVGDGFTGPQGEYYEDFPKVKQLKVIYGS